MIYRVVLAQSLPRGCSRRVRWGCSHPECLAGEGPAPTLTRGVVGKVQFLSGCWTEGLVKADLMAEEERHVRGRGTQMSSAMTARARPDGRTSAFGWSTGCRGRIDEGMVVDESEAAKTGKIQVMEGFV